MELAGISDPGRAKAIVQRSAFLEFRITDRTGALDKALPSHGPGSAERRASRSDTGEADRAQSAVDRSCSRATAAKKASRYQRRRRRRAQLGLIQTAARRLAPMPGEYLVPSRRLPAGGQPAPPARGGAAAAARRGAALVAPTPLSVGVQSYQPALRPGGPADHHRAAAWWTPRRRSTRSPAAPIVTFELDRAGGRKFGEGTGRHVGDYMAILLDDRVQGRPPVIQGRIDRRGQITLGGKTFQEAQDLALTLRAGALPVPLKIVEERQVGASLGADSIHTGFSAGVVGTVLVILIMIGYYHLSGVLAVAALGLYILFTLGALCRCWTPPSRCPGVAGIVLSIGIAVDANVLIFERIREELALGKTVRLAIDEGFTHAMNAIVDSNVTTVLTALFLFQFGTGPVKGFAVTLILGIIASMVTAVFVTRTFYMIWLQRQPAMTTLSI